MGYDQDDLWPLTDIAEQLGVSYKQLHEWTRRRQSTSFPLPAKYLGKYQLYSLSDVTKWYVLWQRVTERMNGGGRLNEGEEE